jgi:triacylglycerol lipase
MGAASIKRMLARIQKLIVCALLLAASGWASLLVHFDKPVWACVGALLILLGYALFLGIEFLLLSAVQGETHAPRPTRAQLLVAWWGEVMSAPLVFLWRQPFRAAAEPDNLVAASAAQHGVVFVHGFVCNRGFWNPWMKKLRARGTPFVAVNLEPLFGTIDSYAALIEAGVSQVESTTNRSVVLVGHSMGGLAIRAWLARSGADSRVRRVVTIGSPHHGTWLARFGSTINGIEMRQNSRWLEMLRTSETPQRYSKFTCFFGHCDNIVFPAESGVLSGARNIHIPGTAHVHMAFERSVFDEVCAWLPADCPDREEPLPANGLAALSR